MTADLLVQIRQPFTHLLKRRLSAKEFAAVAVAMLAAGTIYCQLWCLIAFMRPHQGPMPLGASVILAFLDIVPALAAFELSKRAPRGAWGLVVIALTFLIALACATALRTTVDIMLPANPTIRVLAAQRLGPLTIAAAALAWYFFQRKQVAERAAAATASLPPAKSIDWVKAAGNYVEVHVGGATRLIRMTLRQAADQLPRDTFVQVHRSVIVNRASVATQQGRRTIRMSDGAEIPVGDAYRSNLADL